MFFERAEIGNRAILVHIDFPEGDEREDPNEFKELVNSAGAELAQLIVGSRQSVHPKLFVGSGKIEEIKLAVKACEADVVLFNHAISPSQERNIEAEIECRVLDRTGLILDIFAQRARTHEGKLQVELAQLQYQSTRLVRGWTHLERQKGGIGLRGPGETQLETDRRLLGHRISWIQKRLQKVGKQRDQNRRARRRSATKTVAIVGYTNAGKSTLFNYLTRSDVYAADQMFATLDPTLRRLIIPNLGNVVLADTVGFIRHLPHKLVDAFKATLQETIEADLLLHIVDSSDPERTDNIAEVNSVLNDIGADSIATIEVFNKIDRLSEQTAKIEWDEAGKPKRLWLSAKDGLGCDNIAKAISEHLSDEIFEGDIVLNNEHGQLRAMLYENNSVLQESYNDEGLTTLRLSLQLKDFKRMMARANILPESYLGKKQKEFYEK